jgi:biopolymer transport protein ExbD
MTHRPASRRAARRDREAQHLDMNLVSLIDIFTILIFFLLSSAAGVELLTSPKAVQLPVSQADRLPEPTLVVTVTPQEILLGDRTVAGVADAMAQPGDAIAGLAEALRQAAGRGATAPTRVTLLADKDIPYQLLRKVMSTCAQASFTQVSLATRQAAGSAS